MDTGARTKQLARQRGLIETCVRYCRGRMRRLTFLLLWAASRLALMVSWRSLAPIGSVFGSLHYAVQIRARRRLARDMAVALNCSAATARRALRQSYRVNDRAVFEIVALNSSRPAVDAMLASCRIEGVEQLTRQAKSGEGAVLLGMHMGNGVLMAGALAARGLPVAVVYRESRKLPPGYLGEVMRRIGVTPLHVTYANPAGGSLGILRALRKGMLVYVLMDQGNKQAEGVPVVFLGKQVHMPDGIVRLAAKAGAPFIPVELRAAEPDWVYQVAAPSEVGDDPQATVRELAQRMENQIRAQPQFWSWHQRRWRRYPFAAAQPE